jgi:DNA-binding CsgD family transcriptional regulator
MVMQQVSEFSYRGIERRRAQRHGMQLAVVVVDSALRVKYCSSQKQKHDEMWRLLCDGQLRLRPEIEQLVSKLVSDAGLDSSKETNAVLLDEDRVLRLSPLVGPEETLFALIIGTNHNRDSLVRAAGRYQLTKRQAQVLALILEGDSVGEIADHLCISENTAQGYVKSLLSKTQSRNRPAMVAKVLDWNQSRDAMRVAAYEAREATRRA